MQEPIPLDPRIGPLANVQHAITTLLTTHEPRFIELGLNIFIAAATILIVWHGVRMMFSGDPLGDQVFEFAQLLLYLSFGYTMIAFYEAPIPGFGISFSNLITDQAHYLARLLNANTLEQIYTHLDDLFRRFLEPDPWAFLALGIYLLILFVIILAKVIAMAVVAFGLIASAVCGLVGPLFVPFFIIPKLDFLFWSWLKSFLQYSFIEVVAYAFFMVFEHFIAEFIRRVPAQIVAEQYLLYGVQALVIVGVFAVGTLLIPSLTSSIFTGRAGESVLPTRVRVPTSPSSKSGH